MEKKLKVVNTFVLNNYIYLFSSSSFESKKKNIRGGGEKKLE